MRPPAAYRCYGAARAALSDASCVLRVASCILRVTCRLLSVACCILHVACCMLHVACCALHVACRLLSVACCALCFAALHLIRRRERLAQRLLHRRAHPLAQQRCSSDSLAAPLRAGPAAAARRRPPAGTREYYWLAGRVLGSSLEGVAARARHVPAGGSAQHSYAAAARVRAVALRASLERVGCGVCVRACA
jgi:hypothetical protein